MDNHKKKTQQELLQELESIKGLLLDEADIPVLQEIFDVDKNPAYAHQQHFSGNELAALRQAYDVLVTESADIVKEQLPGNSTETPNKNQGQPPAASNNKPKQSSYNAPEARGENPFLPQHIRARLRGNRMNLSPAVSDITPGSRKQLINDLVRELMPEIEQRLRDRLLAASDTTLKKLLQETQTPAD